MAPAENRKSLLKQELMKLNSNLPARVYLPFLKSSIRNHAVLHISHKESVVFKTKTRAPYMITLELYRPDEIEADFKMNRFQT